MGSMIFLALIIVLVSGLIAYVGDLVGRKMGRKRLTLLGLRPRHTAIVISVGVGMLIAALTLIATLAVNKGVREAFFTPLGQLKADLRQQRAAVQRTREELGDARRQTVDTRTLLTAETGRLATTNTQLGLSLRQRDAIEHRLRAERQQLARVQQEYMRVDTDLRHAKSDLASARTRLQDYREHLIEKSNSIRIQEDNKRALEYAVSEFARIGFSPLSFTQGQEVMSGVLPAGSNAAERRAFLNTFYRSAERIVRQRSTELPKSANALVFYHIAKDQLVHVTEKEAVELLADRLATMKGQGGTIIRLTTANNVPVDGPAVILIDRIELFPVTVAYAVGTVVASTDITVTTQTSTATILGSLADTLLRDKLPSALRAKGMVSISRRFDPNHPDAMPDSAPAVVSWADLMAAAEKARTYHGTVSLIARAHASITNYGPLSIDLDVVPSQ